MSHVALFSDMKEFIRSQNKYTYKSSFFKTCWFSSSVNSDLLAELGYISQVDQVNDKMVSYD